MDTKLVQQYGEDILCYRLRTARQKKRMQYEDFDKYLIQLHKEEGALRVKKWNLGWEPLLPPVQKGWKRCFVLRDDVARSKQAEFFESILKKINTYDWSYRKDFRVRKRRYGRNKYGIKTQQLLRPYAYEIGKFAFTYKEMQCFHEVWERDWKKQPVKRYVFNEPWRFVLRTSPNMIDKVRIRDAEIEKRLYEINNYLKRNDYDARQSKILGDSYKWRYRETKKEWEKNPLHNIPIPQILDSLND